VTGAELAATAVVEVPVTQTAQAGISGWLNVYFTDTHSESLRGGPDSHLATAIDQARVSVDAALYDLSLWSIRDALIAAHNRGVTVRVVVESDALEREEVQALISAGIAVLSDRRESLMHHKFVVIDRAEVWTGSMNLTVNGAYGNNNNLVRLQSSQIAANYTLEFEEMFVDDLFGDASRRNDTPNPAITLNGVQIENYFSPDDGVQAHLVALVDSAQSSVYMLAFAFTADPLADALAAARERGLTVAAVVDEDQSTQSGADYESLLSNGIPVKLDGNPRKMHHKVLIIDEQIVVLGSYNFSRSAEENNDENVLVIHSAELAAQFLAEFALILGEAK
jgi:phosphatidylserine/phosphatidylglycerophosphate/cardiolipin synthase-like enzyme